MRRYFIALGVVFLLVILLVILLFRGGEKPPTGPTVLPLNEYAFDNTSAVTYTQRGRINGDDVHRNIVITVTSDERKINIIQGYQGNVINTQTYSNNQDAYEQFLYALKQAGFLTKKKEIKVDDPNGRCSTGILYYYTLSQDFNDLSSLWSGNCSKEIGTFGGNNTLIKTLFQAQITDYSKITSGVSL